MVYLTPYYALKRGPGMERLVLVLVVVGIVVMVALEFLVLEPTLGHTYFFYTAVIVCVLAFTWVVGWLWRRITDRRGRA